MKTTRFLVTLLVAFILSFVQSCTGTRPVSTKSGSGSRAGAHYASNSAQGQKKGILSSVKQFFGFGQKPAPQIVHALDNDLKNVPSAIRVLPALPYVEATDLPTDPLLVGPIDPRFATGSENTASATREMRILGAESHVITNLPSWNTSSGDAVPEKSTAPPTETTVPTEIDPADIVVPKPATVGLLPTIVPPGETAAATIPECPKEVPLIEEKAAVKVEVVPVESKPAEKVKTEASLKADTVNFNTPFPQTVITKDAQMPLRAIKAGPGFTVGYIARLRISSTGYQSGGENSQLLAGHMVIFAGNIAAAQSPDRLYYRIVQGAFDTNEFSNISAKLTQFPSGLTVKIENETKTIRPPDARELAFNTKTGYQPMLSFTGLKSIVLPANRENGKAECVQIVELLLPKDCETLFCHFLYPQIKQNGLPVAGNIDPDSVLSRITEDVISQKKPTVFLPAEFERARNQMPESDLGFQISANASSFDGLHFYDDRKPKNLAGTKILPVDNGKPGSTSSRSDQTNFGIVFVLCLVGVIGLNFLARSSPDCVIQPISPRFRLTRRPAWEKVRVFPNRTTVGGSTEHVTELSPTVRPARQSSARPTVDDVPDSEILEALPEGSGDEETKPRRFAERPPRSRSTSPIRQRRELRFG